MKYLERFFWQKEKDNHITEQDLERIVDVIDMFADENNMSKDASGGWDLPKLKEIRYYTRYNSREEIEISHNSNTDINFSVYSNNLEFISIEDTFGYMDLEDNWDKYPNGNKLMDKMFKLKRRMEKMCPHLKFRMPKGPMKWNIIITKN